jgi:elongation of very long chain fatty acids protein 7
MSTEINSSSLVSGLYKSYVDYINSGDPRVADWPLMDTPMKTFLILLFYIISIRLIRDYMKDKKPYELNALLVIYNFMQVIGSFYVFAEVSCLF